MKIKDQEQKRHHQIHVPVLSSERQAIEAQAKRAGMKVARYLREVGQGYAFKGVIDFEQVRELAKINGDLGRLGGLIKLWVTNDERTALIGKAHLEAVLSKITATQDKMAEIMTRVVKPRGANEEF